MTELQSVGVMGKRLGRTVSCKMNVDDYPSGKCNIIGSVRGWDVALRIEGGPENWVHMDSRECDRLIKYLQRASVEVEKRKEAYR